MEQLIFDSGIKEYQINGKGVLRFNPSDPNVHARFMAALPKIEQVQRQMAEKAKEINESSEIAGEAVLKLIVKADREIKTILNEIFGEENNFDEIMQGVNMLAVASNGNQVILNLLEALQPIVEAGANAYADEEIRRAKEGRDARRNREQ